MSASIVFDCLIHVRLFSKDSRMMGNGVDQSGYTDKPILSAAYQYGCVEL